MARAALIAPSLLSANFLNLGADLDMLDRSAADWVHVDVMDGRFVPNISFGFPVMEVLRQRIGKPLDVHLMIESPMAHARRFAELGASVITLHAEADIHLHRSLSEIRSWGVKAGVALNPHTPVSTVEHLLDLADLILLMSVNPGFGGQKFIEETFRKLEKLTALRAQRQAQCLIEVDGGVGPSNIKALAEAGADVLVAGSSVFRSPNPEAEILNLKRLACEA